MDELGRPASASREKGTASDDSAIEGEREKSIEAIDRPRAKHARARRKKGSP